MKLKVKSRRRTPPELAPIEIRRAPERLLELLRRLRRPAGEYETLFVAPDWLRFAPRVADAVWLVVLLAIGLAWSLDHDRLVQAVKPDPYVGFKTTHFRSIVAELKSKTGGIASATRNGKSVNITYPNGTTVTQPVR